MDWTAMDWTASPLNPIHARARGWSDEYLDGHPANTL
jgi:hypothetical protein